MHTFENLEPGSTIEIVNSWGNPSDVTISHPDGTKITFVLLAGRPAQLQLGQSELVKIVITKSTNDPAMDLQ